MPFFENASQFTIDNCSITDIGGDLNIFNGLQQAGAEPALVAAEAAARLAEANRTRAAAKIAAANAKMAAKLSKRG